MKDGEAYFLQIRDQIKHEDNLCDNRMTWLISLQSFLFGAYGFTADASSNKESIETARTAFCLVGVLSAIAIILAVLAARHSTNKLVDIWFASEYYKANKKDYPPIIGTYNEIRNRGTRFGYYALLIIPSGCIAAWVMVNFGMYASILSFLATIVMVKSMSVLINKPTWIEDRLTDAISGINLLLTRICNNAMIRKIYMRDSHEHKKHTEKNL